MNSLKLANLRCYSSIVLMFKLFPKTAHVLLIPAILLTIGLWLQPISIFSSDHSRFPGDFGDARFNLYILEHGYQWMSGELPQYWDAPFMYPHKNVIALSDNLLGTVPIYATFRALGCSRESAYQWWFVSMFALNFLCCCYAIYKWSGNLILSSCAAYIFAFSIIFIAQSNHVQIFPRFMIPLVLYWTWKYLHHQNLRYFLYAMLGCVFQLYCGMYLGVLLFYTLILFTAAYLFVYRDFTFIQRLRNPRTLSWHLALIASTVVLLLPLMLPYRSISSELVPLSYPDVQNSLPTIRSYLFTSDTALTWHMLSTHGISTIPEWWNQCLFPGLVPLLSVLLIPILLLFKTPNFAERKTLIFILVVIVLSISFSTRVGEFSFYKYVFGLPGLSSIRAVYRILTSELMLFMIAFVTVFQCLNRIYKWGKWVVYALPVLVVLDNLISPSKVSTYDMNASRTQIDSIRQLITDQYDGKHQAIAFIPYSDCSDQRDMNINVMLAAQELHIPCVNAYTGYLPNSFIDYAGRASKTALQKWCASNMIDTSGIQIIHTGREELASHQVFLCSQDESYFAASDTTGLLSAIGNTIPQYAFTMLVYDNNECAFLTNNHHCLGANLWGNAEITSNCPAVGPWETFRLIRINDNTIALKASNNKYLSANPNTRIVTACADSIGQTETFVLEYP